MNIICLILVFCITIPTSLGPKKNQYCKTSTLEIQMTIKRLLKRISNISLHLTRLNQYSDRDHHSPMDRLQVLMTVCKC